MDIVRKLFGIGVRDMRPSQESLLDLSAGDLKRVYWLSTELQLDPKRVELTRALTQNKDKPRMGLRGTYGLFASSEWWNNINQRKISLRFVSGIVVRAYEAGQDQVGKNNTIEVKVAGGDLATLGIYVDDKADIALFRPGAKVELVYALDELKIQPAPDGGVAYSNIALEMAVSKVVDNVV